MKRIAENYHNVIKNIQDFSNVSLLAVSKGQSLEKIKTLINLGHQKFAENRLDEAIKKFSHLDVKKHRLELHFIGHLQRRKVLQTMCHFQFIHTLDSKKLANKIHSYILQGQACPKLLVQVNIAREPQKFGIFPERLEEFILYCRSLCLPIVGLMCIPPQYQAPERYFQWLKASCDRYKLSECSAGMSADFMLAIENGATLVRVGSGIFGARDK